MIYIFLLSKNNIKVTIFYHKYDLPDSIKLSGEIAIDTEAMGLNNPRDRLCTVQLSNGDGTAHLVHFPENNFDCKNLKALLSNPEVIKIFHFARFDLAILQYYLQIDITNLFCTKVASKLVRTYTDSHGLKILCEELLGVKLSKQERASDWGAPNLTKEQINYAGNDVLYLHKLKEKLIVRLKREKRLSLAEEAFAALPLIAKLDFMGWGNQLFDY
jgi:ribonuclease D